MSVLSMVLHLLDYVGQTGFKHSNITAAKMICTIQGGLNSSQQQVTVTISQHKCQLHKKYEVHCKVL